MLTGKLCPAFVGMEYGRGKLRWESLINRIDAKLDLVQAHQASARDSADSIRGNGRALEAMPYDLVKEIEGLALYLGRPVAWWGWLRTGASSCSHAGSRTGGETTRRCLMSSCG